jgi:hypothetical protein
MERNMRRQFLASVFAVGVALAAGSNVWRTEILAAQRSRAEIPRFQVDLTWPWPPKLPNNWLVGIISFVAVDRHDHVWILHRYRQLDPKFENRAAPPLLEFDEKLQFVQAWGGPGQGYDWPDTEHGLSIDNQDNVWITGMSPLEPAFKNPSKRTDDMILKFTNKGKFLKQFGGRDRHPMESGGNDDKTSVHLATEAVVHPKTNELFVSDGYSNRRVLVLDAETLAFKRMWGAFGVQAPAKLGRQTARENIKDPPGEGPKNFNSVHGIRVSNDGIVYVADRNHRRIQSFTLDGKYLSQGFVNVVDPSERDGSPRPAWAQPYYTAGSLAFSHDPQQQYIYVGDYGHGHVHIVERTTLTTVGSFGKQGMARGDFGGIHALSVDSKGNLWVAETQPRPTGSRVQRFTFKSGP